MITRFGSVVLIGFIWLCLFSNLGLNAAFNGNGDNLGGSPTCESSKQEPDAKTDFNSLKDMAAIWPDVDKYVERKDKSDEADASEKDRHPVVKYSREKQETAFSWSGLDQIMTYLSRIMKEASPDMNIGVTGPQSVQDHSEVADFMADPELAAEIAKMKIQQQNDVKTDSLECSNMERKGDHEFGILSTGSGTPVDACGETYKYDSSSGVAEGREFNLEQGFPPMRHPNCSSIGYLYRQPLYETKCNHTITNTTSCENVTTTNCTCQNNTINCSICAVDTTNLVCTNTSHTNSTCNPVLTGYANGTCICPVDRTGSLCELFRQFNCSLSFVEPARNCPEQWISEGPSDDRAHMLERSPGCLRPKSTASETLRLRLGCQYTDTANLIEGSTEQLDINITHVPFRYWSYHDSESNTTSSDIFGLSCPLVVPFQLRFFNFFALSDESMSYQRMTRSSLCSVLSSAQVSGNSTIPFTLNLQQNSIPPGFRPGSRLYFETGLILQTVRGFRDALARNTSIGGLIDDVLVREYLDPLGWSISPAAEKRILGGWNSENLVLAIIVAVLGVFVLVYMAVKVWRKVKKNAKNEEEEKMLIVDPDAVMFLDGG